MSKSKYQPPKEVQEEHQEFLERIGKRLQYLREEKGITITQLTNELGISRNAYALMEKGKIYFNLLSLIRVLEFYKIPIESFFKEPN